jgi:primosomal protein N' (replication factor Y)
MMTQVAGRAGRSAEAPRGKVVVQTKSPEHWVIQNVVEHTYDRLIDQELLERRNFGYPPFVRMIRLTVRHKDRQKVEDGAAYLVHELRTFLGERVLGPEYPYIPRLKDQYRKEMVVKVEREASIQKVKENIQNLVDRMGQDKQYRALRIIIDVDPQ